MFQEARRRSLRLSSFLLLLVPSLSPCGWAATVVIDLDRSTPGIQNTLTLPPSPDTATILGAVVVLGQQHETVGTNVARVNVFNTVSGGETINAASFTVQRGELHQQIPVMGEVTANQVYWPDTFPVAASIGEDGFLTLFELDLVLKNLSNKADGDVYEFSFVNSRDDVSLGIAISGQNFSYGTEGENPPIAQQGAIVFVGENPLPTRTITQTPTPRPTRTRAPTRTPTPPPSVVIDLDRNTPGIQDILSLPPSRDSASLQGAVVVRGKESSFVSSNVTRVNVIDSIGGGETINAAASFVRRGELFDVIPASKQITGNQIYWSNPFPVHATIGADGFLTLFEFDLTLKNLSSKAEGDIYEFSFVNSRDDDMLGIRIDSDNFSFGTGGENPAVDGHGASILIEENPLEMRTETRTPTRTPTTPPSVAIDLDRNIPGIQDTLSLPPSPDSAFIEGAVVVLGEPSLIVGSNVTQVTVFDTVSGSAAINPNQSSLTNGELSGAIPAFGAVRQSNFVWTNAFPVPADIGEDGILTLFNFTLELTNLSTKADGDLYEFSFRNSRNNPALGIAIDGNNFSYGINGENSPISSEGALVFIGDTRLPTRTITPTFTAAPSPTITPTFVPPSPPTVAIDLDRDTPGIQDALNVPASPNEASIQGSIVVLGDPSYFVGTNVTQVKVLDTVSGSETINPAASTATNGELSAAIPATGSINENDFIWLNTHPVPASIGEDGFLTLCNFDLALTNLSSKADGDVYEFSFGNSRDNVALGILINNQAFSYGDNAEYPPTNEQGALVFIGDLQGQTPTPTLSPTPTPPCDDTGYYLLTSFGDHIRGGDPPRINGSLFTPGMKLFGDAETVLLSESGKGSAPELDLAIMDRFGVVTFVESKGQPPADFILIEPFACGQAVDLEVSPDGAAFWVLTEGGGIYRGGTAKPGADDSLLGNDADDLCGVFPLDFGQLRDPNFAVEDDPATIRMVGFTVLQSANPEAPTGYIVLDSQGGTYLYDGQGRSIRDSQGTPGEGDPGQGLLDPNLVYPFFPGLDIARDIELSRTLDGLAIYDGWGGTHPVPINDPQNSVFYLGNRDESGDLLTTVGLPYLIAAFDDPETPLVEVEPLDVHSIFIDLEFCQTGGPGIYVMDRFGGVFTFGNTRVSTNSTAPRFGGPYFFPRLWAEDMEPAGETGF